MRIELIDLLQKLAIEHEMVPYETRPWVHYDEERGITCSAEVRMGSDAQSFEAEVQFLYDDPEMARQDVENTRKQKREALAAAGKDNEEDEEEDEEDEPVEINMIQRKMFLCARMLAQGNWSPFYFSVKQDDFTNKVGDWEEKACNFFRACVQSINMEEIPDIEELVKSELDDGWGGRGGRGKIGRKAPKVKPGQLLGMKKPGG